jgi:hypothetical protein
MATTILRFEKIKSRQAIRESGGHIYRHHLNTPNADSSKSKNNRTCVGSGNLLKDVDTRLELLDKEPRKNAVLAMDGLLQLSPEAIKPNGKLNKDVGNKWFNESLKWLKSTYGDNLVSAVLHMDEQTPHLHFTVVPLVEKDGKYKLSARDTFNKNTLGMFQKSYFKAIDSVIDGLEPPQHGSKRKHVEISHFYHILDEIKSELKIAGHKMLEELEITCRQQMMDKYIPLIEQNIKRVEQELEGRLTDEVRAKIRTSFEESMSNAIGFAFEDTQELRELQALIDRTVEKSSVEIDPRASERKVTMRLR